jgi:predicted amidohydrolase YtcJ
MKLDTLFVNGRIRTLDALRPTAHSLGVLNGMVVGFDGEIDGLQAQTRIDLGEAAVLPGFHDAHHHVSERGAKLRHCDLSADAVSDLDELYAALRHFAADLPADAWVVGAGYDEKKLGGAPSRVAIDWAVEGRPAWLVQVSHHSGTANTEALRRMGFTDPRSVPDIPGGYVERDATGAATGFLAENAMQLVNDVLRPRPMEEYIEGIATGCQAALADGLTSVTEPGIGGRLAGNGPSDLDGFLTTRDRGLLGVRMTVMPELSALHSLSDSSGLGLDLGIRTGLGDDQLRVGGVKVFSDGALTARTAAMCHDYADRPGQAGFLHQDADQLQDAIVRAHRAGWQVATHAIGDAAVEVVISAYEHAQEQYPRNDPRHRIEHCGLTSDEQVKRIAAAGAIPVPQGRFVHELGDAYIDAVGEDRSQFLYRQRSFLEAGIVLPGSSDCPVVSGSPIGGIHALVNRQMPSGRVLNAEETLTVDEAVRAWTQGSAFADHQESRKGTLAPGRLADLVVLDEDLYEVSHERIEDVTVIATVVGGDVRYGVEQLASS